MSQMIEDVEVSIKIKHDLCCRTELLIKINVNHLEIVFIYYYNPS